MKDAPAIARNERLCSRVQLYFCEDVSSATLKVNEEPSGVERDPLLPESLCAFFCRALLWRKIRPKTCSAVYED